MKGAFIQVLAAGLAFGLICFLFPILEMLEVFFYFTVIPLFFFVALGLITEGSVTMVHEAVSGFFLQGLRDRVNGWRTKLTSDEVECEGA